ncbi:DUF6515 family protein [Thalassomonas actiniarum]|uniref:Uncharacterized protein n=1 Tax=Thalassomonas actiniarum TaxID=485447 RepID=A0AAE9YRC9_9GAMM|nr:DUF6515 family protein [Thalassomonas actiniarum]WDD99675.1 hypothetical protein SG35_003100 [Thalassomonas actiniarum]
MKKLTVKVSALLLSALLAYLPQAVAEQHKHRGKGHHNPSAAAHKHQYHKVGHKVKVLPPGYRKLLVRGTPFYFNAGVFYRTSPSGYVVVKAPLGARVTTLAPGYVSFTLGLKRYFHVNATYYRKEKDSYVVVEKPEGADAGATEMAQATQVNEAGSPLVIYPNNGQSNQQRKQDKFECYQWAVTESGFDPLEAKELAGNSHYQKAYRSCLQGRGYTVN